LEKEFWSDEAWLIWLILSNGAEKDWAIRPNMVFATSPSITTMLSENQNESDS